MAITEGQMEANLEDTPRTDAEASDGWSGDAVCVSAVFARRLERENNRLVARVWELEGAAKALLETSDLDVTRHHGYSCSIRDDAVDECNCGKTEFDKTKAALQAALASSANGGKDS